MNSRTLSLMAWAGLSLNLEMAAKATLPELEMAPLQKTEVSISWPAWAEDFVLEEAGRLTPLSPWRPMLEEPRRVEGRWRAELSASGSSRFYRLRYDPARLRAPAPALLLSLFGPEETNVVAGQPFVVEVWGSFNALPAAADRQLLAPG